MINKCDRITAFLRSRYQVSDYPTLQWQYEQWGDQRPLHGLSVVDATPLFANTLLKFRALLAAGARLTVGLSDFISTDPTIERFVIDELGLRVVRNCQKGLSADIVLDCAAAFAHCESTFGYVELTRSGIDTYAQKGVRCYAADSSTIKSIETEMGTGESFFRAMDAMGYRDWNGRPLVVFGSGKVGRGIVRYALINKANVVVVTDPEMSIDGVDTVDFTDRSAVDLALQGAYCAVMATGVCSAFQQTATVAKVLHTDTLLANMGAQDEFGDSLPDKRVLCGKRTINFTLDEPTHLRFIDATMSLHNYGALDLVQNPSKSGIIVPDQSIEQTLLDITRSNGHIFD